MASPDDRCTHDRTPATCETCAYDRAAEQGRPVASRLYPPEPLEEADPVDVETLVDTGTGSTVLVVAGDPVPAELADQPRRPRHEPKKGKRKG